MTGTVKIPGKEAYDLVVDASGRGDYLEVGLACTAAAAGAVIAIRPGTYVESGDVAPKAGQSLVGLTGVDTNGVVIQLGNNILDLSAGAIRVEGVYFEITASADKAFVDIDNGFCTIRNCTLDFTPTGAQKHRGIRFLTGGQSFCLIENVRIIGDALTYRVISANATVDAAEGPVTDSVFRGITIEGCQTTVTAGEQFLISLEDPERNVWEDLRHDHSGLTSIQAGAMLYVNVTADREACSYRDIALSNDALAADGSAISLNGAYAKPDSFDGVQLVGFYNAFVSNSLDAYSLTNFNIEAPANVGVDVNGTDSSRITSGRIRAAGAVGMQVAATDSVFDNIVFEDTAGTYDFQMIATSNDCKMSNLHGTKEIEISGSTGHTLVNFECVRLDINTSDFYAANGECANIDILSSNDNGRISNVNIYGTVSIGDGVNDWSFAGCEIDVLTLAGSDRIAFAACRVGTFTVGSGATSINTMFSACRLQNGTISDADGTEIVGCLIDGTLTNGSSGLNTIISGTRIGTVTLNAVDAQMSNCRVTATLTVSADDISIDNCDTTALTLANPIVRFRANNCRFRGALSLPTTGDDFQFSNCRFDAAITSVSGMGDSWWSNCHFKSTVAFRGGQINVSGGRFDGAVSLDEGNFMATGTQFISTITSSATHTDIILRACKLGGAFGGSWLGRLYIEDNIVGNMEEHDNTTAIVIDTVNEWHAVTGLSSPGANYQDQCSVGAGGNGAITAQADGGGGEVTHTSAAHGRSAGDIVCITGTTNYNGVFVIQSVNTNDFNVIDTWAGDDAAGSWGEASYIEVAAGIYTTGLMEIIASISASTAGTNQDFEFKIFVDENPVDEIVSKRRFATNDTGAQSLSGVEGVGAGSRVWLGVRNVIGTADITPRNVNVKISKE